jgi:PKHD-type hydroxylase
MIYKMYRYHRMLTLKQSENVLRQAIARNEWKTYTMSRGLAGSDVLQDIYDLPWEDTLHDKLWNSISGHNTHRWNFNLTGWHQPLRVARYGVGYFQDWHVDYTDTDSSKLAFSIPLTSGHEGGQLQLLDCEEQPKAEIGRAIVFPAFHGHRVTPVTSGVRYALLGWATGPRFQ